MAVSARGAVRSLEFDRSGDRLTFITATGMLGLWDWRAGRAVDTHHRAESVALSADGKWAVVAEAEQRVTILELASGHKVFTLPSEGADIWCLAWAGDGMHLAVGLSDGLVALWDLGQVRSRLNQFGIDCPSMSR
jgi:WD40 repeat protein